MLRVGISLFLRFSGAAAKLVLMIYLARYSSPELLGQYALIIAFVAIASQFIGLDVHYFNSRIISSGNKEDISSVIKSQLFLHLISYIPLTLIILLIFSLGFFEFNLFIFILLLIIFEHLSLEVTRFLQFALRPNLGALVLFVRNTLFVIVFLSFSFSNNSLLNLMFLIQTWLYSIIFAFLLGLFFIKDFLFFKRGYLNNKSSYYINLIKKSSPFLIASIFFTLMQVVDRFVLNAYEGEYLVGILFFFISISSALYLFVNYAVGVFHGPIAIKKFRNYGLYEYKKERMIMIKRSCIAGVIALILSVFLIHPLLKVVNQQDYIVYINVFYILLIMQCFMLVSDFFQLDLYVRNMDHEIMQSSIAAGISTFILQVIFIKFYSIYGAAYAALLGVILLTIYRYIFFKIGIAKNPKLMSQINPELSKD